MTRLPTESFEILGIEGPDYVPNGLCPVMGCQDSRNLEAHHIVRRSHLGGAFNWVRYDDGTEAGNVVYLCNQHHRELTENRARLWLVDGEFKWMPQEGLSSTLMWQPPVIPPGTEEALWEEQNKQLDGTALINNAMKTKCPTCQQRLPKPKIENKKETVKQRATWSVMVPADERENGAELIDNLLDMAEEVMAEAGWEYGGGSKVKYYKLTAALGLFVQHGKEILSDG